MNNAIQQDRINDLELRLTQLENCVIANQQINNDYNEHFEGKFKLNLKCIGELHKRIDKIHDKMDNLQDLLQQQLLNITSNLTENIKEENKMNRNLLQGIKTLRAGVVEHWLITDRKLDIISEKLKIRWTG